MKGLIIVESPTKARTLDRFLKGEYDIQASMGHVRDLPKRKIGVDVYKDFAPYYVIPPGKRKVVEKLKDKIKNVKNVILATDPDREGEAIAYHIQEMLKREAENGTSFKRIVFHEITAAAVSSALANPREIDDNLVSSQVARRVLDRVVGYKLSPVLWRRIKRNLSAGRVQSVALRFIVERDREIEKFIKEEYYKVFAGLKKEDSDVVVEFALVKVNGEDITVSTKLILYDGSYQYTKTILDKKTAAGILDVLKNEKFEVVDVLEKETKRSPFPPFTTSSLQQEAGRRFHFTVKKTMIIAQKLYEEGFITYHRTDSFNLSSQFISEARGFVEKEFGKKYLSSSPRIFRTKSKVAQEAHEAIRPTQIQDLEARISAELGRDYGKLYSLIYKKALATQMADAIFKSTKVLVEAKNKKTYLFEKNGSVVVFAGFLKLMGLEEQEDILPNFKKSEKLRFSQGRLLQSFTSPPPFYSEATLVSSLEKNGIGRPSTYAPIISIIQERHYVEKKDARLYPTAIGFAINDFLVKDFPDIDDIPFTAEMEEKLDKIASGELAWVPMMQEFYAPFEKKLIQAEKGEKIKIPVEETGQKCPKCGGAVVIRIGRFGKFYACSSFPNCDYKLIYREETGHVCPKDGGKIVVKKTRRGFRFYACSNYPECKFAVWKLKDLGEKEPESPRTVDT